MIFPAEELLSDEYTADGGVKKEEKADGPFHMFETNKQFLRKEMPIPAV